MVGIASAIPKIVLIFLKVGRISFTQISRKEMASMATQTQWLNTARLRHCADYIAYGHAVLLSSVKLCIIGARKLSTPLFAVAQGLSVPISRGSPPIT